MDVLPTRESTAAPELARVPQSYRRPPLRWRRGLSIPVLASIAVLAGCISEEREQQIGNSLAAEVNPQLPLIDDPLLNAYVYAIGSELGAVSERPGLEYRFYIVDSPVVNAFALPGGHIYLTRGLIARTESGAEFAGVLAHEIGHVAARHGVRKLQRHLRTGSLVNVLYTTIFGGEPELLRDNSTQLVNVVWSARHSRRDEQEADKLAVEYLLRTGVDPNGVITLLETLLAEEGDQPEVQQAMEWFSTHPLTTTRIRDAQQNIERLREQNQVIAEVDLRAFPAFKHLVLRGGPLMADPKLH